MVALSVTDHRPQDVEASAGEGEQGLLVAFPLVSLALVVRLGGGACRSADHRREVHAPQQAAVVSLGSAQVAADAAGVPGPGGQAGEAGQAIGAAEGVHVTAGRGDELGAEPGAHAGQAADHLGVRMLAKPGLDQGVELGDLLIEGHHPFREAGHHGSRQLLAGQGGLLGLGGLHGRLRESGGAADLAVLQPGLDPPGAGTTDRGRGLVAGQEHDRPLVDELQRPLQCRENLQQLGPETVDLPGAVEDHVQAPCRQRAQVDGDLVARPQQPEILAHAGLVGDDEGVLRVSLALAPVGGRGPVDRQAGQIGHGLVVAEQQADQQGGAAVVEVDGPQHVGGYRQDVADELEQLGLVVQDPAGQQPFAVRVDHHAVVMFLADVHPGPDLGHVSSASSSLHRSRRRPRRRCPTAAIESRLPIGGRVVAGLRAAKSFEPCQRLPHDSHTQSPRALRSYE